MADDLAERALRDENRRRRELHRAREPFHGGPQNCAIVWKRLCNLERRRGACFGVPLSHGVTSEGHLYTHSRHGARVSHRTHRLKIVSVGRYGAARRPCSQDDTPAPVACCGCHRASNSSSHRVMLHPSYRIVNQIVRRFSLSRLRRSLSRAFLLRFLPSQIVKMRAA